jgi:hypothetical protein
MEIWRSGSSSVQSNARAKWVEGWEAKDGIVHFREAALPRWPFGRADRTKIAQRNADRATRSRGREDGGLSVWLCGGAVTQYSWLQGVEPADVVRPGQRSIEGFNDPHAAAAARARRWFVAGSAWVVAIIIVAIHRCGGHIEQASAQCQLARRP